jgi:hypothetical protein
MINLIIDLDGEEKEFLIPTSWNEVSVKKAAKLAEIQVSNKTDIESAADIVSVLADIDQETIYMLTADQFNDLVENIKFTLDKIDSPELKDSIFIDGEEYFLKKDFTKLTMGEIISVDTILKQYENNVAPAMAKLLCIFLRKKKENGSLETFKNSFMQRESLFEEVIISDVNNLFLFFLDGENLSQSNTKDYLESQKSNQESEIDFQK